ncbi:MAG: dephospho-CoA kinase [Candidatus Omnitrophota bacterium]|nr:dephospho-CoA kinase [Candidatus Omnitrophota bacterium]
MPVFGLTGNLATGKTTVLGLLKKKGAVVFDVDSRIHRYYRDKNSVVYKKTHALFPGTISRGVISRKKLGKIVFSDIKKLCQLEEIIHPVIIKELKEWINNKRDKKGIYIAEAALLFEKKLQNYFDAVILVCTQRGILINRIMKNLHLSRIMAQRRLELFMALEEKAKKADFVINNDSDIKHLKKGVELLWSKLKASCYQENYLRQ